MMYAKETNPIGVCPKCESWDIDDLGREDGDCSIEVYGRCAECGTEFTMIFGYIETVWEEDDE